MTVLLPLVWDPDKNFFVRLEILCILWYFYYWELNFIIPLISLGKFYKLLLSIKCWGRRVECLEIRRLKTGSFNFPSLWALSGRTGVFEKSAYPENSMCKHSDQEIQISQVFWPSLQRQQLCEYSHLGSSQPHHFPAEFNQETLFNTLQ